MPQAASTLFSSTQPEKLITFACSTCLFVLVLGVAWKTKQLVTLYGTTLPHYQQFLQTPLHSEIMEDLDQLPLFGAPVHPEIPLSDLSESRLDLALVGVIATASPQGGSAILRTPDEQEQTYVAGESLPGGAQLVQILENAVIIYNDGKLEMLQYTE